MPDRSSRKARMEDMLPKDRVRWAREIWADREACARTDTSIGMLREAARTLGVLEEAVDQLIAGVRRT